MKAGRLDDAIKAYSDSLVENRCLNLKILLVSEQMDVVNFFVRTDRRMSKRN